MKRPHVTASLVVVATVVVGAAILQAPYLAILAVPSAAGLGVARRWPRAGAVVMAVAGALVACIAVAHLVTWPSAFDLTFDVVNAVAGGVALVDGLRSAIAGNRVTGLAGR